MRKILSLLLFAFVFSISSFAQQMSDEQVVQYVKTAHASGKSQKQITTELLRRGVTQEQVMRIKDRYEKTSSAADGTNNKPTQLVEPDLVKYQCKNGKTVTFSKHMVQGFENGERAKARSKTFPGVAKAMAEQWGGIV